MSGAGNPFWDFSLALYRQPGVAEASIALQDSTGADVNVTFYLLWLTAQGRSIDAADIARIDHEVEAWREQVVMPLRGVRRWMKDAEFAGDEQAALRSQVKRIELESERLQQAKLAALPLAGEPDDGPFTARAGSVLARYAESLGQAFDGALVALLVEAAGRIDPGT